MTNLDITPAQSLRNFESRSMLNRMDVVTVLDGWLDQLRENRLRIRVSEPGRRALENAVLSMKSHVMANGLPDILTEVTGTSYRYALDWYADGLQLGIERFGGDALFLPDGSEAPPVYEQGDAVAVDDEAAPDPASPETSYMLVHASRVPAVPIAEWAEQNGVKPATARQWATRNRIRTVKEGNSLRVSSIQYTPDAYSEAPGQSHRFKYLGQLPDEVAEKYPILSGMVLDLLITPAADGKEGYVLLSIRTDGPGNRAKADSRDLTEAERTRLLADLYAVEGVSDAMDQFYHAPFFPVETVHHAQSGLTGKDMAKLAAGFGGAGSTETVPKEGSPSRAVSFKTDLTDAAGKKARIEGRYYLYDSNAEQRLLDAIFGTGGDLMEVRRALDAAGIREGDRHAAYPWNTQILVLTGIEAELGKDSLGALLRSLPARISGALCLSPTLVLADRQSCAPFLEDLASAGFRPAGRYVYAYAQTAGTFRGFDARKKKQ